jgi:Secretion system C-terminal sorting domain
MRHLLLLLVFLFSIAQVQSQIAWEKSLGQGLELSIKEIPNGYGIITASGGTSKSYVEIDSLGNLLSSTLLPFQTASVVMTNDGHFLTTNPSTFHLEKRDISGQLLWEYTVLDTSNLHSFASQYLPNGNTIVVLMRKTPHPQANIYAYYDTEVIWFDSNGAILQKKASREGVESFHRKIKRIHPIDAFGFAIIIETTYSNIFTDIRDQIYIWNETGLIKELDIKADPNAYPNSKRRRNVFSFVSNAHDRYFAAITDGATYGLFDPHLFITDVTKQFVSCLDIQYKEVFRKDFQSNKFYHVGSVSQITGNPLIDAYHTQDGGFVLHYAKDGVILYERINADGQVLLRVPLPQPGNFLLSTKDNGHILRTSNSLIKIGPNGESSSTTNLYAIKVNRDLDEDCATLGSEPLFNTDGIFLMSADSAYFYPVHPDQDGLYRVSSSTSQPLIIKMPDRVEGIGYQICSGSTQIQPNAGVVPEITLAIGSSALWLKAYISSNFTCDSSINTYGISHPFTLRKGTLQVSGRTKNNKPFFSHLLPGSYHVQNDSLPQNMLSGWNSCFKDTNLVIQSLGQLVKIDAVMLHANKRLSIEPKVDINQNCVLESSEPYTYWHRFNHKVEDLNTGETMTHDGYGLKLTSGYRYKFTITPNATNLINLCQDSVFYITADSLSSGSLKDTVYNYLVDHHSIYGDTVYFCDPSTTGWPQVNQYPNFPWFVDTVSIDPLVVWQRAVKIVNPQVILITQSVTMFPNGTVTDTLHLLSQYGCDSTVIIQYISAIDDPSSSSSQYQINPNPTKGICTITSSDGAPFDLIVTTQLGQVIHQSSAIKENGFIIDLHHYPPGMYYCHVKNKDQLLTIKLMLIE